MITALFSIAKNAPFGSPRSPFTEHFFTQHRIKADPVRVQALQNLPTPGNQKELQSFLGHITYLYPFIPDLFDKTALSGHKSPTGTRTLQPMQPIQQLQSLNLQVTPPHNPQLL